jgi:hypothetical protein
VSTGHSADREYDGYMGYYRDATPEEIECGEFTAWSLRTPEDARDLPAEARYRRTQEAQLRYDFKVWVPEPGDGWVTAADLIDWGYKPEALTRLFGPPVDGPGELQGWLATHVDHIEESVIGRAVDLLKTSFIQARLQETFPTEPGGDRFPSDAEVAAAIEANPDLGTRRATVIRTQ